MTIGSIVTTLVNFSTNNVAFGFGFILYSVELPNCGTARASPRETHHILGIIIRKIQLGDFIDHR